MIVDCEEMHAERDRYRDALAEEREGHTRLVEDLCALIREEDGDDVAVEALIIRWVTTVTAEHDQYRAALQRIATSPTRCTDEDCEAMRAAAGEALADDT